jgi:hypothetical protein
MKIIYYKFFMLCLIFSISSIVVLPNVNSTTMNRIYLIGGDILMAALVFEFFRLPDEDTHPDALVSAHTIVFSVLIVAFLTFAFIPHCIDISRGGDHWKGYKNVWTHLSRKLVNTDSLPVSNVFSSIAKHQESYTTPLPQPISGIRPDTRNIQLV